MKTISHVESFIFSPFSLRSPLSSRHYPNPDELVISRAQFCSFSRFTTCSQFKLGDLTRANLVRLDNMFGSEQIRINGKFTLNMKISMLTQRMGYRQSSHHHAGDSGFQGTFSSGHHALTNVPFRLHQNYVQLKSTSIYHMDIRSSCYE